MEYYVTSRAGSVRLTREEVLETFPEVVFPTGGETLPIPNSGVLDGAWISVAPNEED